MRSLNDFGLINFAAQPHPRFGDQLGDEEASDGVQHDGVAS